MSASKSKIYVIKKQNKRQRKINLKKKNYNKLQTKFKK